MSIKRAVIIGLVTVFVSCARYTPSELHHICLRWERLGNLYGRQALYNDQGAKEVLREAKYKSLSFRGTCIPATQGPAIRVQMCLVQSTLCGNNRQAGVWEDQVEWYMEKYPGSFSCQDQSKGTTCQECIQEPDDCITGIGLKVEDSCLQYDTECNSRFIEATEDEVGEGSSKNPMEGRRR